MTVNQSLTRPFFVVGEVVNLMNEPIDAQPAASSPAPEIFTSAADQLASLSADDLHKWRMDGKLPTERPIETPADSSPAAVVEDQPASTDASLVAASEPAEPALKAKTKARIDELLAKSAREAERAERAERRAADLEARLQPSQTRPAASSPAPAGPVEPNPEAFPYGTADPGYVKAMAKYEANALIQSERQAFADHQRDVAARAESQRVWDAFNEKAAVAREKHADFDAVALQAPTEIQRDSLADLWVREDDAGAEILYHLQQPANAAERRRILALPYNKQIKELVRLGDRLTGDVPAARSTNAPPPPPALRTRATPGDPVESALKSRDYAAYKRAADERDIAAGKR